MQSTKWNPAARAKGKGEETRTHLSLHTRTAAPPVGKHPRTQPSHLNFPSTLRTCGPGNPGRFPSLFQGAICLFPLPFSLECTLAFPRSYFMWHHKKLNVGAERRNKLSSRKPNTKETCKNIKTMPKFSEILLLWKIIIFNRILDANT